MQTAAHERTIIAPRLVPPWSLAVAAPSAQTQTHLPCAHTRLAPNQTAVPGYTPAPETVDRLADLNSRHQDQRSWTR